MTLNRCFFWTTKSPACKRPRTAPCMSVDREQEGQCSPVLIPEEALDRLGELGTKGTISAQACCQQMKDAGVDEALAR